MGSKSRDKLGGGNTQVKGKSKCKDLEAEYAWCI